jgi:wobble nucleotide-excising tRNase
MERGTEQDDRLDRIEEKIDRLSDVVIQLARVEEKINELEIRRKESHERVNKLSEKIDVIDTKTTAMLVTLTSLQKITWLTIGGVVSMVISHFNGIL